MNSDILHKALTENKNRPKLVYHLGVEAGFFSEYNNMILSIIYCLDNDLRFSIYSKDANFKIKNGWTDFFQSFCNEETGVIHSIINKRPNKRYKRSIFTKIDRTIIAAGRSLLQNTLLMSDIWQQARSLPLNREYNFPSLGIYGNLRDVCRQLIGLTWIYSKETQNKIDVLKSSLTLPANYIGFHIRGGDKFIEASQQEEKKYIDKAMLLTDCRTAFVLTDDYSVIERLRQNYPNWTFQTLCGTEERGYYHQQFKEQKSTDKEMKMNNLFASVDIISNAQLFIGTFSSNPGMYLGMKMEISKTFSVDIPEWVIW